MQNELMKYFDFAKETPTKSAFCQQRAKVSSEAIKFLFCIFNEMLMELDTPKTFRGYRLLACDGSDINIPYNPEDDKTLKYDYKINFATAVCICKEFLKQDDGEMNPYKRSEKQ